MDHSLIFNYRAIQSSRSGRPHGYRLYPSQIIVVWVDGNRCHNMVNETFARAQFPDLVIINTKQQRGNYYNGDYKGHHIVIDEYDYGDCYKREVTVYTPDGRTLYPDMSPYFVGSDDVEVWLDKYLG